MPRRSGSSARSAAGRRVLFVSASGWLGGPGRSLLTLLMHLGKRVELTLVSPVAGNLLPEIRARSLAVTHVPLFTMQGRAMHAVGRVVAIARLAVWIIRHRRDLTAIHANGFSELHLVALGAVLARVPIVVWFHASEADPWDRRLGPVWRRMVVDRRFAAVSDLAREVVVGTGLAIPQEVAIVPNPIDPEDVRALDGSRSAPEETSLVIGYLGSTIADKGFRLLPDIIRRVNGAAVRWAVFLSVAEDDPSPEGQVWSELKALSTGGRVVFLGRKSDVRDAYRECDLVLCPSLRESFGRIAAEAMLNGLPVVASDLEPLRDLIGDDGGLLFPVGDAGAAAAAVQRLVDDPSLRAKLSQGARCRAGAFSPAPIAGQFARLYGLQESGPSFSRVEA